MVCLNVVIAKVFPRPTYVTAARRVCDVTNGHVSGGPVRLSGGPGKPVVGSGRSSLATCQPEIGASALRSLLLRFAIASAALQSLLSFPFLLCSKITSLSLR